MGEWISVKDKLPESIQEVLTIDSLGDMWIGPVVECDGGDYICLTQDEASSITHWMPLPKPPESE